MMREQDVMSLFEERRALLKGHFKLSSGLHSGRYLQSALVLQYPDVAERLARELAARFKSEKIDFVIGPALGGVVFSYEMARVFNARSLFTERENGAMILRRGFTIASGERCLAVEDVVTTGGSLKEVIALAKNSGATVIGAASLVDRSGGTADFGVPFAALATVTVETYPQDACPLCKEGLPVTKPGSRK